jgi:hypothetical protein
MNGNATLRTVAATARQRLAATESAEQTEKTAKERLQRQRMADGLKEGLQKELGEHFNLLQDLEFCDRVSPPKTVAIFTLLDAYHRPWKLYFKFDGRMMPDKLMVPDLKRWDSPPPNFSDRMLELSPPAGVTWAEVLAIAICEWDDRWAEIKAQDAVKATVDEIQAERQGWQDDDKEARRDMERRSIAVDQVLADIAYEKAEAQSAAIRAWVADVVPVPKAIELFKWSWFTGSTHEDGEWHFDYGTAYSHKAELADGWIERFDGKKILMTPMFHLPVVETETLNLGGNYQLAHTYIVKLVGVSERGAEDVLVYDPDGECEIRIRGWASGLTDTVYPTTLEPPHTLPLLTAAEIAVLKSTSHF